MQVSLWPSRKATVENELGDQTWWLCGVVERCPQGVVDSRLGNGEHQGFIHSVLFVRGAGADPEFVLGLRDNR